MAELKLQNLVLRGVRVAGDAVAVLERVGCGLARETTTIPLSFTRHLSPANPDSDAGPDKRDEHANMYGVVRRAQRAGRSGSSAGALRSRSLARTARPAVLSGQPASMVKHSHSNANPGLLSVGRSLRERRATRGASRLHSVTAQAFAGLSLSPHSQSFQPGPNQRPARVAFWRREVGGKGRKGKQTFTGSASGMRSASA
ncbi:MAG: hypothetical protein L0Z62_15835 [Gemmataceae bacterium]|nr:hypothetical protein [Gemmataceae bacterium]